MRSLGTSDGAERHPLARELAARHPRHHAVDELSRLARRGNELLVALGLPNDLRLHALARGRDVAIEPLAAVAPELGAEPEAEPRGRERGEATEGKREARGETHGV